eukprot:320910_1
MNLSSAKGIKFMMKEPPQPLTIVLHPTMDETNPKKRANSESYGQATFSVEVWLVFRKKTENRLWCGSQKCMIDGWSWKGRPARRRMDDVCCSLTRYSKGKYTWKHTTHFQIFEKEECMYD